MTGADRWERSPEPISALREGEVHLWRISLVRDQERIARRAAILSGDEAERMSRYHFDLHRDRFALRRGALRVLLGAYLEVDPCDVSFLYTPRGKPELAGAQAPGSALRFNMSDSEDVALLGVTLGRRIGVDIECVRPILEMDAIVQTHFSTEEREAYRRLPQTATAGPSGRQVGFYNGWTRKEAWLKARGDGLWAPLDGFAVTLSPGDSARLLQVRDEPGEPECWSLHACIPAPGYVGAVAVEGKPFRVALWAFDLSFLDL